VVRMGDDRGKLLSQLESEGLRKRRLVSRALLYGEARLTEDPSLMHHQNSWRTLQEPFEQGFQTPV
jgi:hypothetical protein